MSIHHAKLSIPYVWRFVADGTPDGITVVGPNSTETLASTAIIQDGSTKSYVAVFTPDVLGRWVAYCEDSGNNVLASVELECVRATDGERALGVEPVYHGLVDFWPERLTDAAGQASVADGRDPGRYYISTGKHLVPYSGWIYGVKMSATADCVNQDELRFFSAYWTDEASSKWKVRDYSEDFSGLISYTSGDFGTVYYFKKPVWANIGDMFGFFASDTSGNTYSFINIREVTANAQSAQDEMKTDAAWAATTEKTASSYSLHKYQFLCKLMMAPPSVLVAGHSIPASHCGGQDESHTIFEATDTAYDADQDIAAMLEKRLGVPCCNVSDGGTNIEMWRDTYIENCEPFYAPLVVMDTLYNDGTGASLGGDVDKWYDPADEILARLDQLGSQLMLVEPAPSRAADAADKAEQFETFINYARAWCELNNVPYIPLHHRLGMHSGGDEHEALRRYQKAGYSGVDDYSASSDSYIHLTTAGRYAYATALAEAIRGKRMAWQRASMTYSTEDRQTPVGGQRQQIVDYLDAAITSRSSHSAAEVQTTMEANGSKLDHLWETTEDDGGVRRFSTNALEQAPSGSPTVAVTPYAAQTSTNGGTTRVYLESYQHAQLGTWIVVITDDSGDAVDLSGKDLAMVFWESGTDASSASFSLKNYDGETDITIGGASNNQLTITGSSDYTTSAKVYEFVVRNITDGTVVCEGQAEVKPAANVS